MSKSRLCCLIYAKILFFLTPEKIFQFQVSWNSLHVYRRMDRQTWQSWLSLSAILITWQEAMLYPFFTKTESVNNTSRKFGGNWPVSSRSDPGGQQAREWNVRKLFRIGHSGNWIEQRDTIGLGGKGTECCSCIGCYCYIIIIIIIIIIFVVTLMHVIYNNVPEEKRDYI